MTHRDNRARLIARSLAQRESSAYQMLLNAYSHGLSDDEAIAWAVAAMGKEDAGIVARVWAKRFTVTRPV